LDEELVDWASHRSVHSEQPINVDENPLIPQDYEDLISEQEQNDIDVEDI
jgi:hypothetical protein